MGQKFINYLGPEAFNSLNLIDKKYLRTNYSIKNVNRYLNKTLLYLC